jgi:hypothetical protein
MPPASLQNSLGVDRRMAASSSRSGAAMNYFETIDLPTMMREYPTPSPNDSAP